VSQHQLDHQQVLKHPQCRVRLSHGQRGRRVMVLDAAIEGRYVQGGRARELLEFGEHRRGRVPQLQPVQR
jgi:hypothetical protein